MIKNYLEVGKIVSLHGLKGELNVQPWCNSSDFFCKFSVLYLERGKSKVRVTSARPHKNVVIVKLEGVDSPEQAEALRGKILYLDRSDINLPKGEYFIQDIIGLKVFDKSSSVCYGQITEVLKTGANDVYKLISDSGKVYLIPVINDVICEVNIDQGFITISPIEGLFDD